MNGSKIKTKTRSSRALLFGIAAGSLLLAGCTTEEVTRGYVFSAGIVENITPGIDNINSVRREMGNPSIASTFQDNIWYYIADDSTRRSFMREQVEEHRVVQIIFDERGVVSEIREYGTEDMVNVNPVPDETPTRGRTLGFFEQIFGNIGRFAGPGGPGGAGRPPGT